ncbi:MAG TPA: 3-hydroxyacyl-CoA dehydrogenase family protein [Bryobacteraceae bacterium]|nr:3-hydroxyacyl-CoA dehydrogenase family protein [Bryobacteraceae bacterium]
MKRQTPAKDKLNPKDIPAGVIGLGLMGHSIIACLLSAGHPVVGVTRSLTRHRGTRRHVLALLRQMKREGLLKREPGALIGGLTLSEDYEDLARCGIVIESIIEDIETKKQAYRAVEEAVPADTIIGSNTSSIPLSLLQAGAAHPERFVGIHWDEPAHVTRFMEIIAGEKTRPDYARRVKALAALWGKEPSLLRRDVRGFITNRVSYAMFREACHLVDSGIATVEDVDRSLRNDVGWWITFAGPFRYMDLMGVEAYYRVMKDLLPELSTSPEIPSLMRSVVEPGGRGISNGRGFYRYTTAQSKRWEKLFLKFNYEIRRLAMKYPEDVGNRTAARRKAK